MYFGFKPNLRASCRPPWGNIVFLWHVPTCFRPASGDSSQGCGGLLLKTLTVV